MADHVTQGRCLFVVPTLRVGTINSEVFYVRLLLALSPISNELNYRLPKIWIFLVEKIDHSRAYINGGNKI